MARTSASFWLLLGVGGVTHVVAAATAAWAVVRLLPCHVAVGLPTGSSPCVAGVWSHVAVPIVAGIALLILVLSVSVRLARTVRRQLSATGRVLLDLRSAPMAVPATLAHAATSAGIARFELVDGPATALTHGLLRPTVLVTTELVDALDEQQLSAVLAHESHHARRRDPLRLLTARSLAASAPAVPLLAELAEAFIIDCEIAADQHAADQVGERATLTALQRTLDCPRLTLGAPAAAALDPTVERIRHFGEHPPPIRVPPRRLLTSGLTITAILTISTAFLLATTATSHVTHMPVTPVAPATRVDVPESAGIRVGAPPWWSAPVRLSAGPPTGLAARPQQDRPPRPRVAAGRSFPTTAVPVAASSG